MIFPSGKSFISLSVFQNIYLSDIRHQIFRIKYHHNINFHVEIRDCRIHDAESNHLILSYRGYSTWHKSARFGTMCGNSLALHGDTLAVGVSYADHNHGIVRVINRLGGLWRQGQIIREADVR